MKKRIISITLAVFMVVGLLPSVSLPAKATGEGTGTAANGAFVLNTSGVNTITNADQFAYMAQQIKANTAGWVSASYKLGNNIDLSSYPSWEPIGRYAYGDCDYHNKIYPFLGTFDGAGFAIKNLKVTELGGYFLGLFGKVGSGGTVKNLAVIDSYMPSSHSSGTIAGENQGTIQNCYSNGKIGARGDWAKDVGGIVGVNKEGTIENCYFSGDVPWLDTYGGIIGGIWGKDALNCYRLRTAFTSGTELGQSQMKGKMGETNYGWSEITISGVNKGKLSLVDALNQWVSTQTPGEFTQWYCTSFDGNDYPGFSKEQHIVTISDGSGVGTTNTTAAASLTGAITNGTTCVAPGEMVTITVGAPSSANKAGTVSVYKTGDNATTVPFSYVSTGVYKFTMPRYPVTIATSYDLKSTGNNISEFKFNALTVSGKVDNGNNSVTVIVPNGTNVSSLSPSITVSSDATINPVSGTAQNFTSDVTYTVTAENGSTQNWNIIVLKKTATPIGISCDTVTSMLTGISDGMEYSVDGGTTWVTITGSASGKVAIAGVTAENDIQVRNNGTAPHTAPSDARTINIAQAVTPAAPTISAVTANSVTLTPIAGNEYSKDGSTWQASNLFDNLSSATEIIFYQRVVASGTTLASIKSDGKAQYTSAAAPSADTGYSIHYQTEEITVNSGYEVSNDANFGTIIANNAKLTPGTTYYIRVAASGGVPASAGVSVAIAARPSAPAAITAANVTKTENTITIANTLDGQEYQVNGTWYTPSNGKVEVTSLAVGTEYSIVTRLKANTNTFASANSAPLTVKTKTAPATAPATPTICTGTDKPTSNSIAVSTVAGNEYYISTSSTADWSGTPNGYVKATVNGTHKFDSLNAATQYYIHVRVAETDAALPSASSNVSQYTLPVTPTASDVTINYKTETISFGDTYEVRTAQTGGSEITSNGSISSIIGPTPQSIYVRVKAINSGAPVSEWRAVTVPARSGAPTAITAAETKNSITVSTVLGQEYRIGNGTWQDSGTFEVLSPNTDYTVFARVKAVSSGSEAFASEAHSEIIKTKSDGSLGFALPTFSVSPTYTPGKTLNDVILPGEWAWSTPTTVPTVTNSGYIAVCTPTDTGKVDYSGVDGYTLVDGKVTITRTVPLTVNRATPTAADFTYTAPTTLGYDNTAKSATVTVKSGISGMGTVTVKYYDENDAVVDAPTHAGTYTVIISVAQGENYATFTDLTDNAWRFTIDKIAQDSLSMTNKPTSVTYGDTFTLSTTGGSGTGAVTWAVTKGDSATVNESTGAVTVTGVGETTITASKAADGNHTEAVTNIYTFTPAKRQLTLAPPSATGGWTKTYDTTNGFNTASVSVGNITKKVGADTVTVAVQSASYDTVAVGSGNKSLTIMYSISGDASGKYTTPANTVISIASITPATPTIKLENKIAVLTGNIIAIDAATVKGVASDGDISKNYTGAITYTYYTKEACTDADKTTAEQSGAQTLGGAPKNSGTYYVKATIAAAGNYAATSSVMAKLTIYSPSHGGDTTVNSGSPIIVDGKVVEIGTSEVKDGTTTVKIDQNKMDEKLKNASDSVVVPITSKTNTATAQLVVQNVEAMAAKHMDLVVTVNDISYNIPAGAVDTATVLKELGASDSAKVPLSVTISHLSTNAVTIKDGKLMVPPVKFTVLASYNGKNTEVDRFENYVQRVIEIPKGVDPKSITTAVIVQENGTDRHVPTEVYSKSGTWFAKINSRTNSTYALIQNNVSFSDANGKWYQATVTEMASRKVIAGIGMGQFAGERAITRAEFVAIMVRALGLPTDSTAAKRFTDVSADKWYYGAVGTAYEYGLVTGHTEVEFAPNANITRQEAMTMMSRAAKVAGYSGTTGSVGAFSDANTISAWASDAAKFNVGSGLIVGNHGQLRPQDQISRAETATVILRLLQKAELVDVRN